MSDGEQDEALLSAMEGASLGADYAAARSAILARFLALRSERDRWQGRAEWLWEYRVWRDNLPEGTRPAWEYAAALPPRKP